MTAEVKKRKRGRGPFTCLYPDCGKIFSRSDHLARHSANHTSGIRYICQWPECGRPFTRLDVKKKHESRHRNGDKNGNLKFEDDDVVSSSTTNKGDVTVNKPYINKPSLDNSLVGSSKSPFSAESERTLMFHAQERNLNSPFSLSELRDSVAVELNEDRKGEDDIVNVDQSIPKSRTNSKSSLKRRHSSIIAETPKTSKSSTESASSAETTDSRLIQLDENHVTRHVTSMKVDDKDTISQVSSDLSILNTPLNGTSIASITNGHTASIAVSSISDASQEQNGIPGANLGGNTDSLGMLIHNSALSPSQLIRWLLQDPINVSPTSGRYTTHPENGAFHGLHDGTLGSTTVAMLEEIFALTPEFPNANYQTDVDESLLVEMFKFIPSLKKNPDFESHKIKWFLEIYWLLYHSQYPILHRPSFSTYQVHPLLLLSMIMIGASFAKKTHVPEHIQLVDAEKLADQIADPLRWLLFSCDQAKPPCNSWVIQSLLLLETFEITQTSRSLHERACIYNGAKIQLLRRSPILGGDPLKAVGTTDLSQSTSLWNTWIESESMKRVAWMSFYIDTIHAVVFGHPVNLYANQVKLSLPCTEEFWEYDNIDRNNAPASIVQMPIFSDSLKKLLQKEPVNTGPFGRKILLAGLLNLILQLELKDSQSSIMGWHSVKESWQETISSALEFWKSQLPGQSCCSTTTCVYHTEADGDLPLPSSFLPNDTRCKFPEYHAAQIYLRISHYDYIVYAGAPKRMNVPILPEDYEVVVKRISKWVKSPSGPVCVIHSLIILCEMLISADNSMNYIYDAHSDPFIYRPNVVISAILSLWSYAFHSFGPESLFMAPDSRFQITGQYVPALEDACSYLRRVRDKLGECTGRPFSSLESLDSSTYGIAVKQYASCLNKVENLNNLVGLLFTLRNAYRDCKWETGKEYSKLLDNCMQRSMGSSNIFCVDMYDVRDLAA